MQGIVWTTCYGNRENLSQNNKNYKKWNKFKNMVRKVTGYNVGSGKFVMKNRIDKKYCCDVTKKDDILGFLRCLELYVFNLSIKSAWIWVFFFRMRPNDAIIAKSWKIDMLLICCETFHYYIYGLNFGLLIFSVFLTCDPKC